MRRVVNQIVRDIHPDRRMMAATATAGETAVHSGRINAFDLREIMDVVVHNAMTGGNAR